LRIGINALYLLPGRVGGSEVYVRGLVEGLSRLEAGNEYVVFVNRESSGAFDGLAPAVKTVECPIRAENRAFRIAWEQGVLPFQLSRHGIDVLVSAGMTAPFFRRARSVLVLYDLQHAELPGNFSPWRRFFLRSIIYLSARSADMIITLSARSRREIVGRYGISRERVAVTRLAAGDAFFASPAEADIRKVRERYSLPERFIVYPASTLPHKNHPRLLEAFRSVRAEEDVRLVLIGARDGAERMVARRIEEMGLGRDVMLLGWLPFEDVPLIYRAAALLVYPTLYEGFGLPVVEAMASGTPVVCSGIEPVTEAAGDAALFVDPLSAASIAKGILSLLRDRALRDDLVRKGLERARLFRWDITARETLSVIRSAAGVVRG
jgi:glycosyltransferase involved in cell wall biosynthesis